MARRGSPAGLFLWLRIAKCERSQILASRFGAATIGFLSSQCEALRPIRPYGSQA